MRGPQAVTRAVAMLQAFDDAHREWGVTELARRLGLSKSTAHRLLAALVDTGMVVQDSASELYRLGPEAISLGARALRSSDLRQAGRRALEELARTTGETASLEVLLEDEILILEEVPGSHLVGSVVEVGTRWPAHATSTGKLLLAHRERLPAAASGDSTPEAYTPRTVTRRRDLERELEEIRRQGFATASEELERGYSAVAAPLRDHLGRVVAALSIGGPTSRLGTRRLAELGAVLLRTADRVSMELGWNPATPADEVSAPARASAAAPTARRR